MTIYVPHSKILIAGLSYVQPAVEVYYLQVNVMAEVTMPDVLAVDIVTPTDELAFSFSKKLADTAAGVDEVHLSVDKRVADMQPMADSVKHRSIKKLADSYAAVDNAAFTLSKFYGVDQTTLSDAKSLVMSKAFTDTLGTPIDGIAGKVISKALADSISFTDSVEAHKLYIRAFTEMVSTPDSYVAEVGTPESDLAIVSDMYGHILQKNFFESTVLIDNMDGDIQYAFIKVIGELVSMSDTKVIDFAANKSDNVTSSDGGVLSMQDYCDITYFLEDYVGISRTF